MRIERQLDILAETNYELQVQKNIGSIVGKHLQLRRVKKLRSIIDDDNPDLQYWVNRAEDEGVITEVQNNDMWLLDLICSSNRKDNGNHVYVAAEIAISATSDVIFEAKTRAAILRKATNNETVAAVITEFIDQECKYLAEQSGVIIIPVAQN